jgi:hypothetical protein
MKLEFHPEAQQEFLEALSHYEAEVSGLGERFDAEVRRGVTLLRQYPELGATSSTLYLPKPFTLLQSRTKDVNRASGSSASTAS